MSAIDTKKLFEEMSGGAKESAMASSLDNRTTLEDMGVTPEGVEKIVKWAKQQTRYGVLATYIPALKEPDPDKTAIAMGDIRGNEIVVGDGVEVRPSVQSVIKSFLYLFALKKGVSPDVISGVEPTAVPFNADRILQPELAMERAGHPLNNAGAISSSGAIGDFNEFLDFMRVLTRNSDLNVLTDVFESEMATNSNNRAIAQRLVVAGRFKTAQEAEDAVKNYTAACSLGLTATDLLRASLVLASGGINIADKSQVVEKNDVVRVINAMNTFGMYEQSGRVALLTSGSRANSVKSGVGGLINSVDPNRGAFATYSPLLNSAGNSVFGSNAMVGLNAMLSAPDSMRLSPATTAGELDRFNRAESLAVHKQIVTLMQQGEESRIYRADPKIMAEVRAKLVAQLKAID